MLQLTVFNRVLFSCYNSKTSKSFELFNKIGFHYLTPVRQLSNPFFITVNLKDVDQWDRQNNKFIKVPNVKIWEFGAYSKWGIAPCT